MFYIKMYHGILAEMKHHICKCRVILEEDVQPLQREELDPYFLKLPLLHRHIFDVSELIFDDEKRWGSSVYNERRYRPQIVLI